MPIKANPDSRRKELEAGYTMTQEDVGAMPDVVAGTL
jgi:hypothetical protein